MHVETGPMYTTTTLYKYDTGVSTRNDTCTAVRCTARRQLFGVAWGRHLLYINISFSVPQSCCKSTAFSYHIMWDHFSSWMPVDLTLLYAGFYRDIFRAAPVLWHVIICLVFLVAYSALCSLIQTSFQSLVRIGEELVVNRLFLSLLFVFTAYSTACEILLWRFPTFALL